VVFAPSAAEAIRRTPAAEAAEVLDDLGSLADPRRDINELASLSPSESAESYRILHTAGEIAVLRPLEPSDPGFDASAPETFAVVAVVPSSELSDNLSTSTVPGF
jgi:hypothetical protein